jgi:hypothetical protein
MNILFYDREANILCVIALVNHRASRGSPTLAQLIQGYSRSEATDPRDKIYAILHLASDITSDSFVVDYKKSMLELYFDMALFFCKPSTEVIDENFQLMCSEIGPIDLE